MPLFTWNALSHRLRPYRHQFAVLTLIAAVYGFFAAQAPVCLSMDTEFTPSLNSNSPRQHLGSLLRIANTSPLGHHLLRGTESLQICFAPRLNSAGPCGFAYAGLYRAELSQIELNPLLQDQLLVASLVHEARHHWQAQIGADSFSPHNHKEAERIILHWLGEADARLATLVFAHERLQAGEPGYLYSLRQDLSYVSLIAAFYGVLDRDATALIPAMQAVIRAFRDDSLLTISYDNAMADWIDSSGFAHNHDRPTIPLLGRELLYRHGSLGNHGNYMDENLVEYILNSYSDTRYLTLLHARVNSDKTHGGRCAATATI